MPPNQNLHQTVTRFGCAGFSMYACGFSVPQMQQFCLFSYPPRSKWASYEQIIFFLPKSASAAPRWPNDICSAADNAIFKNRAQNIEYRFSCVARSTVLLKPNVASILLFNFCEQKFIQHGPITTAIDCNGLSLLIFKEKWLNYASGQKSALNSESFWVCWLFNVCVLVFCASNATIFLVCIPAKIKMSFIWKDDFLCQIGIFCKSIACPFPSVVQAYTQPYSFGGRIKLIICQIRHELSVTIHEISGKKKR